jgi:hypothetical protein
MLCSGEQFSEEGHVSASSVEEGEELPAGFSGF